MDTSSTDAGQWQPGGDDVEDGKQLASFALLASVTNRLRRWTPDGDGTALSAAFQTSGRNLPLTATRRLSRVRPGREAETRA